MQRWTAKDAPLDAGPPRSMACARLRLTARSTRLDHGQREPQPQRRSATLSRCPLAATCPGTGLAPRRFLPASWRPRSLRGARAFRQRAEDLAQRHRSAAPDRFAPPAEDEDRLVSAPPETMASSSLNGATHGSSMCGSASGIHDDDGDGAIELANSRRIMAPRQPLSISGRASSAGRR